MTREGDTLTVDRTPWMEVERTAVAVGLQVEALDGAWSVRVPFPREQYLAARDRVAQPEGS